MVGVVVLFVAIANKGMAQEGGAGPCRAEIDKFCEDVQPGGGRIRACLTKHEAELSKQCRAALGRIKVAPKTGPGTFKWMEACADDRTKLCNDVKIGEGRVAACLKEHKNELSAGCKAALFPEKKQETTEKGKEKGKE